MKSPKTIALVALIIGLIVGSGMGLALGRVLEARRAKGPTVIKIGALLAKTGDLASYGKRHEKALKLAEEDINAYVKKLGLNIKFEIIVEDTGSEKEGALKALQSLAAQGVKVVLGPLSSGEVEYIMSYANEHEIVVFSHSSTAASLAIPGDYIFRLVITDVYQGKALAKLLWISGIRKVAVIYRGDPWGIGLFEQVKKNFEALGGKVEGVKYDPKAKELSAEVRKLSEIVKEFGISKETGVLLISFEDDGATILKLASEDPALMSVRWFGCDGTANSLTILSSAGDIAYKVGGLPSTIFAPPHSPLRDEFVKRFKERFGEEPDIYAMNIYDAAWIVALAILQVGKYDGKAIREALPEVAKRYYGITGWTALDEAGDRIGEGRYLIYAIVKEGGEYKWKEIGVYNPVTDTIEWFK